MLKLKNINLTFNGTEVFSNFNLLVEKGERVGIKGVSGRGKSTLLNIIMGFQMPDYGEVEIAGLNYIEEDPKEIRRKIAWLPQNLAVFGISSVRMLFETIFNYAENRGLLEDFSILNDELRKLNLDEQILEKELTSISGGEKQRVGLIISKLLKREILLLDEPSSALDNTSKQLAVDYIFEVQAATILVVSHDDYLLEKCTRVISL